MNIEFKEEILSLKEKIAKSEGNKTVFYGSSSIRLWESLDNDLDELDCLNIAFGGSTIGDCINSYTELLKQTTPSQIIFYGGDNDLGQEVGVEMTYNRFMKIYEMIREDFPSIPFAFISIKPSIARASFLNQIKELNVKIEQFLSTESNATYLDIFSGMMNGTEINADLFIEDDLHMNAKGYAIWTEVLNGYFGLK